jgi:hypothetical protein
MKTKRQSPLTFILYLYCRDFFINGNCTFILLFFGYVVHFKYVHITHFQLLKHAFTSYGVTKQSQFH